MGETMVGISESWGSMGVSNLGNWSSMGVSNLSDWSSGVGDDWGWGSDWSGNGNSLDWLLVDIGLGWNLLMKVGLSWNLLVNVGLSWNLLMNVGLSWDLLVLVFLSRDLLVDVGLSRDLLVDVGLSSWVDLSGVVVGVDGGNSSDGWGTSVSNWSSSVGDSNGWGNGMAYSWKTSISDMSGISGVWGSQVLAGGNGKTRKSSDKSLHFELMNC